MAKWKVHLESVVEAKTRAEAWRVSRQIFEQTLDYIAQVQAVSLEPVLKPTEWIAINEEHELNKTLAILKEVERQVRNI